MNGAYGKAAAQMIKDKVPDLTVRKICLKAIKDKTFDTCLDTLFTGPNKASLTRPSCCWHIVFQGRKS